MDEIIEIGDDGKLTDDALRKMRARAEEGEAKPRWVLFLLGTLIVDEAELEGLREECDVLRKNWESAARIADNEGLRVDQARAFLRRVQQERDDHRAEIARLRADRDEAQAGLKNAEVSIAQLTRERDEANAKMDRLKKTRQIALDADAEEKERWRRERIDAGRYEAQARADHLKKARQTALDAAAEERERWREAVDAEADEPAILGLLRERIDAGRETYGPWHVDDERDNPTEALEEIIDALQYCAAELLRLRERNQ